MIRLIVSDVDGTILKKNRALDADYYRMIKKLRKKGILFALASGRPYHFLKDLFFPVLDDIYFICHDGAALIYRDKLLFSAPIDRRIIGAWASEVNSDSADCLLLGKDYSYYSTGSPVFRCAVDDVFGEYAVRTADLGKVDADIYKMAFYGNRDVSSLIDKYQLSVAYQMNGWCELVRHGVNKMLALNALCTDNGIAEDEIMAFGDGENDRCVLDRVGTPYIMLNAKQRLLKRYEKRTGSVLYTIQKEILNVK